MSQEKKFIITQDKQTYKFLLVSGFKLINQVGNTYTFLNDIPTGFNFADFDKSKMTYSNMLSL